MLRASQWSPDTSVKSSISPRQLQVVGLPLVVPGSGQMIKDQTPGPKALDSSGPGRFKQPRACIARHQLHLSRFILTESGSWSVWAFFPKELGAGSMAQRVPMPSSLVTQPAFPLESLVLRTCQD